jgi:hypothetical protein
MAIYCGVGVINCSMIRHTMSHKTGAMNWAWPTVVPSYHTRNELRYERDQSLHDISINIHKTGVTS